MKIHLLLALALCGFVSGLWADVAVLTQHNNPARTGANLDERILNAGNVNANGFGLIFTRAVDDQIFTQPLVVTDVDLGAKGRHNVVIVTTANDSVYGFDADDPSVDAPYWHVTFLGPNAVPPRSSDMTGACGGEYADFTGNIGVAGTPVIDPVTGTLYVLARTKEDGTNFVQRLHALDVRTGAERPHSPVTVAATCPGTGDGSVNGVVTFDPLREGQRAGLALVQGVVYVGWSSHCDWGPYHGWLIGYDATTLKQTVVYNSTPDGGAGGIWMSGQAPAADESGNLYICVGNGSVGTSGDRGSTVNRGQSFLKFTRQGNSLQITSWFTPGNWQRLNDTDDDFGNSGPLLIPGTKLALSGGKNGRIYLVNRDKMGGLSGSEVDSNIVQTFQVSAPGSSFGLYGSAVWWDGPDGSYAYVWCKEDWLRQYRFDPAAGKFLLPEYARGPKPAPAKMPGGILSLSADGKKAGSGIVWASHAIQCDANHQACPGILEAFNAQRIGEELWDSDQAGGRDSVGNFAKFVPPTVANGKVYLATYSNRVNVYGLLPHSR